MDFCSMKRKELQSLCKKSGIPANLSNVEMATRLASLEKVKQQKMFKSCLKNLDIVEISEDENDKVNSKGLKRVRFSPENETFEFEKTDPRELRLLARKRRAMVNSKMVKNPVLVAEHSTNVEDFERKLVAICEDIGGVEEPMGRNSRRRSVVKSNAGFVVYSVDDVVKNEKKETPKRNLRSRGKKTELKDVEAALASPCVEKKPKRGRRGHEIVEEGVVERVDKPPDKIATRRSMRSREVRAEKSNNIVKKEVNEKSENVAQPCRRSARHVEKAEATSDLTSVSKGQVDDESSDQDAATNDLNSCVEMASDSRKRKRVAKKAARGKHQDFEQVYYGATDQQNINTEKPVDSNPFVGRRLRGRKVVVEGSGKSDSKVLVDDCLTRKSLRGNTKNAEKDGGSTPMQAGRRSTRRTERLKSDASLIEQVTDDNVSQSTDHINSSNNQRAEVVNPSMEARDSALEKAEVDLTDHQLTEENIGRGAGPDNSILESNPEVEEQCHVTLASSPMEQKTEKFDAQISTNSSPHLHVAGGTTKAEDSIGSNNSNETTTENVEVNACSPLKSEALALSLLNNSGDCEARCFAQAKKSSEALSKSEVAAASDSLGGMVSTPASISTGKFRVSLAEEDCVDASEPVCHYTAKPVIPEKCKSFDGDGTLSSYLMTDPGCGVLGGEKDFDNKGDGPINHGRNKELSKQENQLEESPGINKESKSEHAIKNELFVHAAAIVGELDGGLVERGEVLATGQRSECVSWESECSRLEVSDGQGMNRFVPDERVANAQRDVGCDKVLVDYCLTRTTSQSKTQNAEKDGGSTPMQAARRSTRRTGKLKSDASPIEQVKNGNVLQSTEHINPNDNRRAELVSQLVEARDRASILEKADVVLTDHSLIEQNIGGGAGLDNSLPANENLDMEELCDLSLGSSSMKQNAEKFDTQISTNSSQEFGTTKSEDSVGSNKSNEKVPENVEAHASEPVCHNAAKSMIPENCKSFGGDGKLLSCSETDPEDGMMGSEKVIRNTGKLSEQENQLEESPCINEGSKSKNAIKTTAAATVGELDDQLIEREEATGSRERCEYVSGESECPSLEVFDSQELNQFVSDKKYVVGGEANLETNAQHSIILDGSTLFAEASVVTVCKLMEYNEGYKMITPMGNLEGGTSSSNTEEPNMDELQHKDGCKVMSKSSTVSAPLQSKVDGELRVLCSPMKGEESCKETMSALSCFKNDEFSAAKQLVMAENFVDTGLQHLDSEDYATDSNEHTLLESGKAVVISDKDVDCDANELSECMLSVSDKTKDLERSFGKAAEDPKANISLSDDDGAHPGQRQKESLNPLYPGSIISSRDIKDIRNGVSGWSSVMKSVVPEISFTNDDKGADLGDKSINYLSDVMEEEMHKVSQVKDTNPSTGVEEMNHSLGIPHDSFIAQECYGLESMVDTIGSSPCKSAMSDESISKEFTIDIHNAPENTGRRKLGEARDTKVTGCEGPCSSPFSILNQETNFEGVKGNCDRDQAEAKSVCPAASESQSFGGNEKVTDEIEGPTRGASEVSYLPSFDGYVGISKVDVALKKNERDVNNLEDASMVRSDNLAHGGGRPENLRSSSCGIADVPDVLVDQEMLINSEQVECTGDQGKSRIEMQNVNEEQLNSHVQEAAALVADDHFASERPKDLRSSLCGVDGMQFALGQVEHGENGSPACDGDIKELGDSMVSEHHDDKGNELDSVADKLDVLPCKLTIVDEATLDALMNDMHDTPGNTCTGVEKLAEATSIREMGCLVLCRSPSSLINRETSYEDVKGNHEANQAKAKDIACPMVEPQSFGKDEKAFKATNDIEEALQDAQEVGRLPLLDESVGTIKDNVAKNESDLGEVEKSEDARLTRSDDLASESHEDLKNSSCGTSNVSVAIDDEKMNNSEEVIPNEDQGFNPASVNETVEILPPMSPMINSRNPEAVVDKHDNLESTSGSKLFDVSGVKEMALSALCNHSFSMLNQETSYESCNENSEREVKEVKEASATIGTDGHSFFSMPEIGGVPFDVLDDRCLSIVDHSIGENNCVVNLKEEEHDKFVNSVEFGEGSHIAVEKFSKQCEMASESSLGCRDNNDDSITNVGSFSPWPCALEDFTDQLPERNSRGSISASQELHSTESAYAASTGGRHLHKSKELECNNVESCMFSSWEIDLILGDMAKDDNSSNIQQPVNAQTIDSPDCTTDNINVTSIADRLLICRLSANNSDDTTENVKDIDETDHVDSKVMRSLMIKRKNSRSILIHGTPRKKPLFVHDIKENTLAPKTRLQMVDVTAVKPMVRRKALEDLQN